MEHGHSTSSFHCDCDGSDALRISIVDESSSERYRQICLFQFHGPGLSSAELYQRVTTQLWELFGFDD